MLTVWITGASSGIGEACARCWAAQGAGLVLTASSAARLEPVAAACRELGSPRVVVLPYDFRDPDGIQTLAQQAWEVLDGLDIVY